MTFNQLIFQMFKINFRNYWLFFLSSSFTVMIFFTFSTLYTNPEFTDPTKINSRISSNLYAPGMIVVIFSVFFVMYAQTAFGKFRKSDYGLFIILGMTPNHIRNMILLENAIIATASILTGIGIGTLFSFLFFTFITIILGIKGFSFFLSPDSYLSTLLFFSLVYAVIIAANFLILSKYKLGSLLNEKRAADRNIFKGKISGIAGLLALSLGVYDMVAHYNSEHSYVLLRSLIIGLVGIYLLLSSLPTWLSLLVKRSKRAQSKNLLFLSDLNYSFGQSRKILFTIIILITMTLYFCNLAASLVFNALDGAVKHNPYHIVYPEIYGKNEISEDTLNHIIKDEHQSIVFHKELEFTDLSFIKILSDQNLNAVLGTDYHVQPGHFLQLSLTVPNDGYHQQVTETPKILIRKNEGEEVFVTQGVIQKMLFNRTPFLGDRFAIFNSQDYIHIEQSNEHNTGYIHLLDLKNWKKTEGSDNKLNLALELANQKNTKLLYDSPEQEASLFKTGSRIAEYKESLQSGNFLLFLMGFVAILFYFAAAVMLHFKIATDFDRERIKFRKLNQIGITSKEVARLITTSFRLLFFLPYVLGIAVAGFYYITTMIGEIGSENLHLYLISGISIVFLGAQFFYYYVYIRKYIKRLLNDMKL